MRISDWSSDVCSSDLVRLPLRNERYHSAFLRGLRRKIGEAGDKGPDTLLIDRLAPAGAVFRIFFGTAIFVDERLRNHDSVVGVRSEEHTSELQSLMRISYAVFCLKKKKK